MRPSPRLSTRRRPLRPPPPRRGRWRLWLLIALLLLLIAVPVALVLLVQSDLPRQFLVAEARRATGLDVSIDTLQLSASGNSSARGISVRVPLEDTPLLTIDRILLSHASLLSILTSGDPALSRIELRGLQVNATENQHGQWSPLRALEHLEATSRSSTSTSSSSGLASLPTIECPDATIVLTKRDGTSRTEHISLLGSAPRAGEYTLSLTLPGSSKRDSLIEAHLDTVTLEHNASLKLAGLDPVLSFFAPDLPRSFSLDASWHGAPTSTGAAGTLSIREFWLGPTRLEGPLEIIASDAVSITPQSLIVDDARFPFVFRVEDGQIRLTPDRITLNRLRLIAPDFAASASATFDPAADDLTVDLSWTGAIPDRALSHKGELNAHLAGPSQGPIKLDLSLATSGTLDARSWSLESRAAVTGTDWSHLDAQITLPTLAFEDPSIAAAFSDVQLHLLRDDAELSLTSLRASGIEFENTSATMNLDTLVWSADFAAQALTLPNVDEPFRDLRLLASGDGTAVILEELTANVRDLTLAAQGRYDFAPAPASDVASEPPVSVHLTMSRPADPAQPARPALQATFDLAGVVSPLELQGRASIESPNLVPTHHTPVPLRMGALATVTTSDLTFQSDGIPFLQGLLTASGRIDFASEAVDAHLAVADIDLAAGSALLKLDPPVSGRLSTDLDIILPTLALEGLSVEGPAHLRSLQFDEFIADEGTAFARLTYPDFTAEDINLTRLGGTAQGTLSLSLLTPNQITLNLRTTAWPAPLGESPLQAALTTESDLRINTKPLDLRGTTRCDISATFLGDPFSEIEFTAALDGQTAETDTLRVNVLGGVLEGSARVPLLDWTQLAATLTARDIQTSQLPSSWRSSVEGLLDATMSGTIVAAPDPEGTLGPLRIDGDLAFTENSTRALGLKGLTFISYAGPERILLDQSRLDVAGGFISTWARLSRHDTEPFLHTSFVLNTLDVRQLGEALAPQSAQLSGTLSGPITIGGYVRAPHRAFGEAQLTLLDADLGRLPFVSQLYNLLSLEADPKKPAGQGRFLLRLEGDRLDLTEATYFNRGTAILGSASLENVWLGGESPVQGAFLGGPQPFPESPFAFNLGLSRLAPALLNDAVTVRLRGTPNTPETQVVPFADIAPRFRRLINPQ